ncbi:Bis(5'-adenosyl)-triphosphatase enpp4 [Echinococcus granulosus]|uniref:Ectonucleotide pyrophosphatase:phosphodiesterase n=2 Tax=Echinococcus granulosus TaxID=6210 RepID=A0A068WKL7_ECHGR|nr:Bis(5'-adenosyl)-triphosphatase enpp4 [Echinococcus granulosus]CDS20667.1 ectonucleotide pyrophosphatase:phosphodiesterase [Echinococcus granulosus]
MLRYTLVGHCLLLLLTFIYSAYCANKVLFISFDGFRHDYLDMAEKAGRNISAFKRIRDAGFQAEVQNVMITLTFPSHYAMATGRNVENHGLVGNNFYDPVIDRKYNYKKTEKNIQSSWFEYADAEPLWSTNERHGSRSCVFQWVGSEARVHNRMAFATSGVYNTANTLQYRVDRIMDWISRDEFNLAMMYYNQPDSNGHRYGPNSTEVMDAVEETNSAVALLLQRIEQTPSLKGKINIVISSDHGMTYVNPNTSPATLGLWTKNETMAPIAEVFKRINGTPHLNVYYKDDIPDRYHFKNNYRIAPIYAIADNGWLISSRADPYVDLYGMHGYDNEESDMHPFMLAMGPDIPHLTERQHFYQIDLYPYICAMLGLDKPNKIDGLIDRVLPYLKERPSEQYLERFRLYASGTLTH